MRLLPIFLGLLFALPAQAQQAPGAPPPGGAAQPAANLIAEPVGLMIAGFDSDGDARVTRAEYDAGVRHSFDAADSQKRGSLGYVGFSDWAETWLGNRNALPSPFEVDTNGDNRITLEELANRFDQFFTRFDTNKDGVIARAELVRVGPPQVISFERDRRRHAEDAHPNR